MKAPFSPNLDELEQDALTEIVNIAVSKAASALRLMLSEQVLLTVPKVEIVDRRQAGKIIQQREGEQVVAVGQSFSGGLAGTAMLIFPDDQSLNLVRAVVDLVTDGEPTEELEQEALSEIGNVVLGACVATFSNMLEQSLQITLPTTTRSSVEEIFVADAPHDDGVLFVYINFDLRHIVAKGYFAIVLDVSSMRRLSELLRTFISKLATL